MAIKTLVSRIAFTPALPWINRGLVKLVNVGFPIRIWWTIKDVGNLVPGLPADWIYRDHTGSEAPTDRYSNLLSSFGFLYEIGELLSKLRERDCRHVRQGSRGLAYRVKDFCEVFVR